MDNDTVGYKGCTMYFTLYTAMMSDYSMCFTVRFA